MESKAIRGRILFAASALILLSGAPLYPEDAQNFAMPQPAREAILKKASLDETGGTPILRLAGTPYEMGYQHGALLKDRIREFFTEDVLGYLNSEEKKRVRSAFPHCALIEYFRSKAESLEKYIPEDYRQDLKGLSEACGLSYGDVVLMHTVIDNSSDPRLGLSARFRDLLSLNERRAMIFYAPQSGNKFVTVGHPGMIGALTGMNEKGVTLEETGYGKTREFARGIPILFLLRQWLQYADSPYDAIRIVSSSQRTIADSVVVADIRTNEGCVIDFDTKEYDATFESEKVAASLQYFIGLKDRFNIAVSEEKPIDPFEFYSYEKKIPEYKMETK